jgi:succinate dehydrogenase / fumarate reductase iron-sulfur subunit
MKFKIKRFDGERFYWDEFEVPVKRGMTVLEALYYIKENLDGSLAFRSSCRMGVCGSCAMIINGKPRLACETQVSQFKSVKIEPLKNFRVIKDLVTDFAGFFTRIKSVKPYLIRYSDGEIRQTPEQLKKYYLYTLCIKCGSCISACPVAKSTLGPAPIVVAYRFNEDSRDEGKYERLKILSDEIWHCHFVSECSEVCPKGINPAEIIQKLRLEVLKSSLRW